MLRFTVPPKRRDSIQCDGRFLGHINRRVRRRVGVWRGSIWMRRIPFLCQEFLFPQRISPAITWRFFLRRFALTGTSSLGERRILHGEDKTGNSKFYLEAGLPSLHLREMLGEVQALFQDDGRKARCEGVHFRGCASSDYVDRRFRAVIIAVIRFSKSTDYGEIRSN